jgi:TonB family protein
MKSILKGAAVCLALSVPAAAGAVTIGEPIHSFRAPELSDAGVQYSIDDFKGKVVLLTVWASWCGACRAQMPEMVKLQKELGPKGLATVALCVDTGREAPREYLKKLEEKAGPIPFRVLHDRYGSVADGLGYSGLPTNWIIGRDGTVLQIIRGGFGGNPKTMRKMLAAALAGKKLGSWGGGEAPEDRPAKKPGAPLKIDASRVLVDGGLDRETAARGLEREALDFRICYEAAREKKAGLKGEVLIRFVVDEKGRVEKAVVEQSYAEFPPLEECLLKAVSRCAFPAPKGGKATVRYPFVFTVE